MKQFHFLLLIIVIFTSCKKVNKRSNEFNFTFDNNQEGWIFGYADYPANLTLEDSLETYSMSYKLDNLPTYIKPLQKGLYIKGANRSDDLFMFVKKEISGLNPSTSYSISFDLEIASNAPTNAFGIGGAPAESVYIKVGATTNEPKLVKNSLNHYHLNIDKGEQSTSGKDMVVIGNVGVTDTTTQFTLIHRNGLLPTSVKSNSKGKFWVIIGTDSGYEGLTELYYSHINLKIKPLQ